jgi:hypothetical protein
MCIYYIDLLHKPQNTTLFKAVCGMIVTICYSFRDDVDSGRRDGSKLSCNKIKIGTFNLETGA